MTTQTQVELQDAVETANESVATPVADKPTKNTEYLKGDSDLLGSVAYLEKLLADPANKNEHEAIQAHLNNVKSVLAADINLRTRVVAAVDVAEANMDVVLQAGNVVESISGKQVVLPYGMHKSLCDLSEMTKDAITSYANEVAPGTDMANVVSDLVAPLSHRSALAEIILLKLRMFYATNVFQLEPRSAAQLGELVADAEATVNGTYPAYLARLEGYTEKDWQFTLLNQNAEGDLSARKLFIYADGKEMAVTAYPFIGIMHTPQGTGALVDYSILQLVAEDKRVVPSRAVGCWRVATEEEAASDAFKGSMEIYTTQVTMYQQIQTQLEAQEKAQQQAANASAAGLILPEGVKKGDDPKLILPN